MMNITIFVLILFTAAGPATSVTSVESMDQCPSQAQTDALVGKQIPGPDNEPILIIDAQGFCKTFIQQRQAKK
jgi:hypothetical protein